MNILTHTKPDAANMTFAQGNITAKYSTLVALFGEPGDGDGYKVSTDWIIQFESEEFDAPVIATIYDWKSSDLYEEGAYPVHVIRSDGWDGEWNIGGFSPGAAELVHKAVEDYENQSDVDEVGVHWSVTLREHAMMVAALRLWQRTNQVPLPIKELAAEFGDSLDDSEIDELIERMNQ